MGGGKNRIDVPERVHPQDLHEILGRHVGEQGVGARDAGVGEDDVQAAVAAQGVVDDGLDGGLVGGVEAAGVDGAGRVAGAHVALVAGEEGVVKVADVDGAGAVLGVLVGGGAADAQGRVGARDDDDLALRARAGAGRGDLADGGDLIDVGVGEW